MKRRTVGFTLIELLVVIAIIAILAAILFPVFARARAKAQQVSCLTNIKQATLGMHMYASDYDDFVPTKMGTDKGPPYAKYPCLLVVPYVETSKVMECPLKKSTLKTPRGPRFAASYHTFGVGVKATLGACNKPTETVYWNESYVKEYAQHAFVCNVWSVDWSIPRNDPGPKPWDPAHSQGNNFGFVDGHAKWHSGTLYRDYADWRYAVQWRK